jgi:hypothetical protein
MAGGAGPRIDAYRKEKAREGGRIDESGVSQPSLVPDLAEFLGRVPCEARPVRGSILEVTISYPCTGRKARDDLDLYLAAWRGLHPNVETTLLET